jgi:acetylornithine aminotransferase
MTSLLSEKFFKDPRVVQAKQLIRDALAESQKMIQGPKEAAAELTQKYQNNIAEFQKLRGGSLFFPYLGSGLGKGALVELADGSIKYDFITGIGVHVMGHSHDGLMQASLDGALADTIMQGNLQQNTPSLDLCRLLVNTANRHSQKFAHCFLSSSGVMAGENALKIAFQKKSPAHRLLAFNHCFMGRTMALSQATDKPSYRHGLPTTLNVDYVPFYDENHPKTSTDQAVATLKEHLKRYPGQHAAMSFELVQGEGGFHVGHRDFFVSLMSVLKEHGVAILVDEVQTFLRTTEPFAFQYFGLDDYVDIVWVGKSSQVCATIFSADFNPKPGLLSQTFTASSTAVASALYILPYFLDGHFYGKSGKIAKLHDHFVGKLKMLAAQKPHLVRGPFGLGAMVALTPLDGTEATVKALVNKLFNNGVMTFSAGHDPARLRFLMPFGAVTTADIDAVVVILEKTLGELTS